MKTLLKIFAPLATALSLCACTKDLNTLPLNPSDYTSETAYGTDPKAYVAGLTKIYFQFVSNSTEDLQVSDGGASELIRAFWSTQETTADEAKCAWENDAWVRALNTNTWSEAQNDAVYAVYVRTLQGIAYVNEYLRQTSDGSLSERGVGPELQKQIQSYRAEARFLRAYLYWMALDTFGDVPFTTEDSPFGGGINPAQKPRAEVFDFCVSELQDLLSSESSLPAARSNYPRADKGAAAGLLARLYLNAEVYTGKAMWAEAKKTCEDIFSMGYKLCADYPALFRGDNGENPEARSEMLWAVGYNAEKTQTYGGTSFLSIASISADDIKSYGFINGVNNGWGGIRVPYEFVEKFFAVGPADYSTGDYTCTDERGKLFFIQGRQESMRDALYVFLNGWSCIKFNNIPSGQTPTSYAPTAKIKAYSDIDFPMIRLGEIELIYAESCLRLGDTASGLDRLNSGIIARAHGTPLTALSDEAIVAERARELMWEGHRRTDLIRLGLFNTNSYLWPYKGGSFEGQGFDAHLNVFSIPPTELAANPELYQNPGYATIQQ